jgi:hypothetical protein
VVVVVVVVVSLLLTLFVDAPLLKSHKQQSARRQKPGQPGQKCS